MATPTAKMAPGDNVLYDPPHGNGFGENANGGTLSAEMMELDLQPGTTVLYHSDDADSTWPIIEWTDSKGIMRMTTIYPDVFLNDFHL